MMQGTTYGVNGIVAQYTAYSRGSGQHRTKRGLDAGQVVGRPIAGLVAYGCRREVALAYMVYHFAGIDVHRTRQRTQAVTGASGIPKSCKLATQGLKKSGILATAFQTGDFTLDNYALACREAKST